MYGVGYPVLESAVMGEYLVPMLVLLLVGKIVATSLTIAIGGSGGVFAPSLFMGAMLGAGVGQAIDAAAPGLNVDPGAYAIIGMAAVFSGAARAPITAVLILFELTGEYSMILPLMLAVVIATGVSSVLSRDTIYTLKLRRRGIDLRQHPRTAALGDMRVREAMTPAPAALTPHVSARTAYQLLLSTDDETAPVVTATGEYVGVVAATAVARALAEDDDANELTVADISQSRDTLDPDATVDSVLDTMLATQAPDGMAVLDDRGLVVGWLRHDAVLRAVAAATASG